MRAAPQTEAASAALSLLSAQAVRDTAHAMLGLALAGRLSNFRVDIDRLAPTADFVADVIRANYPDLRVPLHARWRHFIVGGRDLWAERCARTTWPDAAARARAAIDLAVVSVLLDAGAGPSWRFKDAATGTDIGRSEGLALASLRMFEAGLFSAEASDPLRADASRLAQLTSADLARGFGVSDGNPLTGLDGRAALLQRLGRVMSDQPAVFAQHDSARPGGLFDVLAGTGHIAAADILRTLLIHLGAIWTGRLVIDGVAMGDVWRHSAAPGGLVPLHKLSQWLSYSLIEPLRDAGIKVAALDGLTGLAEYRNGGLFTDLGVLTPRDPSLVERPLPVDDEAVVEWRTLTVALLDRIAPLVRERLGASADQMPLGSVLEGGTWAAGRLAAKQKRADGSPPLTIISDGTVF